MMLRLDAYREEFVKTDGLATIMSVLNGKANFQLQYQLIFCLWFDFLLEVGRMNRQHKIAGT
jgi:V-type H+-transporting ATPase subunit H